MLWGGKKHPASFMALEIAESHFFHLNTHPSVAIQGDAQKPQGCHSLLS